MIEKNNNITTKNTKRQMFSEVEHKNLTTHQPTNQRKHHDEEIHTYTHMKQHIRYPTSNEYRSILKQQNTH